jgi:superoxide dismutase
MRPLFFSVLKYFTTGKEACRADVQDALRAEYGSFKAFKDKAMDEALMTACSNGLIEESKYELDDKGNLVIFYKANQEGIDTINSYIKD